MAPDSQRFLHVTTRRPCFPDWLPRTPLQPQHILADRWQQEPIEARTRVGSPGTVVARPAAEPGAVELEPFGAALVLWKPRRPAQRGRP